MGHFSEKVAFIWSVADLLRGDFKQSEYGKVILPMTVLARLDAVLAPTKEAVLARAAEVEGKPPALRDMLLRKASGEDVAFYNTSALDLQRLLDDPEHIAQNLMAYISGFSENVRAIFTAYFRFEDQIAKLERADLLYQVLERFTQLELHPDAVPNHDMGLIFEELIRKFSEQSNETAGEHFTPREVIKLMVELLFAQDRDLLEQPGVLRTLYDPACGTGGMLSVAQEYLHQTNPRASLEVYGQELNDESFAICKSDMMIKGQQAENIKFGNSFSEDGLPDRSFDYMLSNPPFGVSWKKVKRFIEDEHKQLGHRGRFGAGTPRVSDGSLLFLQHMLSKRKRPEEGGSRLAVVFNGSPLFTGSAGSGESEIRRWIIENDWLEAIVALPDQMFYNTGIHTYVWILTNRKHPHRRGKVQLIDGTDLYQKMRKSLGDKRHEMTAEHIQQIVDLYRDFTDDSQRSKVFCNEDFGFHRVKVERPLRLRITLDGAGLARLDDETAFSKLAASRKKDPEKRAEEIAQGQAHQEQIRQLLRESFEPGEVFDDRGAFLKRLKKAAREADVKLTKAVRMAICSAFGAAHPEAEACYKNRKRGELEPDSDLRDYENIPLSIAIEDYFAQEVLPHVPDAWIDESYTRVGYEIPFTRHFYQYQPPRPLAEIEAEILAIEDEIQGMLRDVVG